MCIFLLLSVCAIGYELLVLSAMSQPCLDCIVVSFERATLSNNPHKLDASMSDDVNLNPLERIKLPRGEVEN